MQNGICKQDLMNLKKENIDPLEEDLSISITYDINGMTQKLKPNV
jgi:hypothetical protein